MSTNTALLSKVRELGWDVEFVHKRVIDWKFDDQGNLTPTELAFQMELSKLGINPSPWGGVSTGLFSKDGVVEEVKAKCGPNDHFNRKIAVNIILGRFIHSKTGKGSV